MNNHRPQKIHLVGHSLGGGLASAAALVHNLRATTFNAAGVHSDTVGRHGGSLNNAKQLINAFRDQGEILSTLQDGSFSLRSLLAPTTSGVGVAMPNGVGTNYWLPGTSWDPISRHLMDDVIQGLDLV